MKRFVSTGIIVALNKIGFAYDIVTDLNAKTNTFMYSYSNTLYRKIRWEHQCYMFTGLLSSWTNLHCIGYIAKGAVTELILSKPYGTGALLAPRRQIPHSDRHWAGFGQSRGRRCDATAKWINRDCCFNQSRHKMILQAKFDVFIIFKSFF